MNTVTIIDPTDSDFIYLCDWVAVTVRGYNEEPMVCGSYAEVLDFIACDDEDWDYQPRLRIRRMLAFYNGNIRVAREDNNLEEAYWAPGTPSEFQSSRCMPRAFIVPEQFVREVAETPPTSPDSLCRLLREAVEVHGADADEEKGSAEWQARATSLEERIRAVLTAMDASGAPLNLRAADAALRRFGEGY